MKMVVPDANNKGINRKTVTPRCEPSTLANCVSGRNDDKKTATMSTFQLQLGQRSNSNWLMNVIDESKGPSKPRFHPSSPDSPPQCHQVWDPWTVEGGNVTISFTCILFPTRFSSLPNFPHSSFLLHLFTFVDTFMDTCSYSIYAQPHAQSLYAASCTVVIASCTVIIASCTVRLLGMRSLVVQYIRTGWTLLFFS